MTGKIKKIYTDRFFGFITGEDGKDYFFHGSQLIADESRDQDTYTEGEKVTFDVVDTRKGKAAKNVYHAEA